MADSFRGFTQTVIDTLYNRFKKRRSNCSSYLTGFFFLVMVFFDASHICGQPFGAESPFEAGAHARSFTDSFPLIPESKSIYNTSLLHEFPVNIPWSFTFNSGNSSKSRDFRRIFNKLRVPVVRYLDKDLKEIDSTPVNIVVHKASQFSAPVIVDDSALHVQGAQLGTQIKWLIKELPHYIGRKAEFVSLIAFNTGSRVCVFRGAVHGTIVDPKGPVKKGFEFNPFFLPDGAELTIAQSLPDAVNPRFHAMQEMMKWNVHKCVRPIHEWKGAWQSE